MKINSAIREQMKNDIKVVCDYFFQNSNITEVSIGDMHNLWFKTFANRQYTDDNPNVKKINGVRILEQDDNYQLYPCDTNDNTLQTALISIFKDLGISVKK